MKAYSLCMNYESSYLFNESNKVYMVFLKVETKNSQKIENSLLKSAEVFFPLILYVQTSMDDFPQYTTALCNWQDTVM